MAYLTQYSSTVPVIKYHIDQVLMTIGQDIDMDICVPEDGIAEHHAMLEAIKSAETYRFIIKSTENDVLLELNGEIVSNAEIQDGDWLTIGGIEFQFTDDGVNSIVEEIAQTPVQDLQIQAVSELKVKPKLVRKITPEVESNASEALQLIRELKEDLQDITKPLSTKEFIANSRQSRRRLSF